MPGHLDIYADPVNRHCGSCKSYEGRTMYEGSCTNKRQHEDREAAGGHLAVMKRYAWPGSGCTHYEAKPAPGTSRPSLWKRIFRARRSGQLT